MNSRLRSRALHVSPSDEPCLAYAARLWLRTALVAWAGWLGLLGVLWVRF